MCASSSSDSRKRSRREPPMRRLRSRRYASFVGSGTAEHRLDARDVLVPLLMVVGERTRAASREFIDAAASPLLFAPAAANEPLILKPAERRINRSFGIG